MPTFEESFLLKVSPFIKDELTGKKLALDYHQGRPNLLVINTEDMSVSFIRYNQWPLSYIRDTQLQ